MRSCEWCSRPVIDVISELAPFKAKAVVALDVAPVPPEATANVADNPAAVPVVF